MASLIPVTTQKDKRTAVFGLGGSGMATAHALVAGGADVSVFDDNPERIANAARSGFAVSDFRETGLHHQSALVLSPGVPLTHPMPHWSVELAKKAGVPVIGDIELFSRERRAHAPECGFIAITGTNGKSTTTALISHVLRQAGRDAQMGGNIGMAVLSLDSVAKNRIYVVECSSYQIDLAPTINPSIGILLNLSPDHLDRHGTMDNYAAIKERLVAAASVAVVGADDNYTAAIGSFLKAKGRKVISISATAPVAAGIYLDGRRLVEAKNGMLATVADLDVAIALKGDHN
jgi:UDP-N-acetylmuramoylalanine--D-glutamate ligase